MENIKLPQWIYHSYGVAEKMYQLALAAGKSESVAKDMWLLGFLHDVGKRFGTQENHEVIGGMMLSNNNYEYYDIITRHGDTLDKNMPWELKMLRTADLSVEPHGNDVGIKDRVEDIKKRYGSDSLKYSITKEVADYIKGEHDD